MNVTTWDFYQLDQKQVALIITDLPNKDQKVSLD